MDYSLYLKGIGKMRITTEIKHNIPVKEHVKGNVPDKVLSVEEVMRDWKKRHFYEVAFLNDMDMAVLYGDLDVEVKNMTREEYETLNEHYRVALKTHIGSHTFALASGSSYDAHKISWRFYIPDLVGTWSAQKEYIEHINKERLITLPDNTPVKLDCSVYHVGRKMRMLHAWKQIKDKEGNLIDDSTQWEQRPLVLVEGREEDTILHNIREDAEIMKSSRSKRVIPLHHDDFDLWRKLVLECWNEERSNDFVSWRNGIWAIKSVEKTPRGLELAHDFSKKSYKYSERETDKIWDQGKDKITGKSIHFWARQDNPIRYAELTAKLPIEFLEENIKEGDKGLGNIFAKAFEGMIVSISHSKRDTHYWAFNPKTGLWEEANTDYIINLFTEHMKTILTPLAVKLAHDYKDIAETEEGKVQKKKMEHTLNLITAMTMTRSATKCMPQINTKLRQPKEWEDLLNNNPAILPVANGVLCLKTGTLRPYDLEDYLTFKLSVSYEKGADISLQKEFISQILHGDKDAEEFFQYFMGYCITGENNREELLIEEGTEDGANAKSHMNQCFNGVMGRFYSTGDRKAFNHKPDGVVNNDSLYNARFSRIVVINEMNKDDKLDAGQIKTYTGCEPVSVCAKFKNEITYMPRFKIILPLNNMIQIPAELGAMWRRIVMVQFKVQFLGRDSPNWDDELHRQGWIVERDDAKGKALKADREGWLEWLVQGAMSYYENQSRGVPKSLQEHMIEAREDNDPYLKYIKKECVLEEDAFISVKELAGFVPQPQGITEKQHSNRIGTTMKKMKIKLTTRTIHNEKAKKVWLGLRKKTQEEKDAEE